MRTGRPPLIDWHGTQSGYKSRGCKCPACREAHAASVRRYRARSRLGTRRTTVDATPVRAHILKLRDEGMTFVAIAREAAISTAAVRRIAIGDRERVWAKTAVLVLAIPLAPADPGLIDDEVVRRLRRDPESWRAIGATREERIEAGRTLGDNARKALGLNAQRVYGVAS
jgi:hypothetical protein